MTCRAGSHDITATMYATSQAEVVCPNMNEVHYSAVYLLLHASPDAHATQQHDVALQGLQLYWDESDTPVAWCPCLMPLQVCVHKHQVCGSWKRRKYMGQSPSFGSPRKALHCDDSLWNRPWMDPLYSHPPSPR